MHARDAVFLEDLCPKLRVRRWRQSLHDYTNQRCIYCGKASESIDHVMPRSRGGLSVTENCVPACLACNGHKSDTDAFDWYRRQRFYDPRRAMAIRAWVDGDLRLAMRLLQWATPDQIAAVASSSLTPLQTASDDQRNGRPSSSARGQTHQPSHPTGQAAAVDQHRQNGQRQRRDQRQRSGAPSQNRRAKESWDPGWGLQPA